MFFKDFVSVKRQKIKRGASQTYDTPSPIKENLIVKIEISNSDSYSGTNLFLVLCILRVEVGPTAHPVVAAIEGSDVGYGVETCPAGETCGTEQWASCDRSIAICTNQ